MSTALFAIHPRAGIVTALFWGIGLAFHYFGAIGGPELRRRLLEHEVKRQIAVGAPEERRSVSDRHVRSLEDLSAQVAHEIRNPITAAKSLVQQMGEDPASADNVAYAKLALEETAGAFSSLVDDGIARYVALSNYTPERVDEWMSVADREGFHRPVALQPQYNLLERGFEAGLRDRAERYGLGVLPYYGLARGFLAGKYRDGGAPVDSPRAEAAAHYLDDRGRRVLAALDEIAAAHRVPVASVALAWLRCQPTVVAPIASARNLDQLVDLLASADLQLTSDELAALSAASA